jgi:hypothetical protein
VPTFSLRRFRCFPERSLMITIQILLLIHAKQMSAPDIQQACFYSA